MAVTFAIAAAAALAEPTAAGAPRFRSFVPALTPKPGTPPGFSTADADPWYSLAIAPNGDVYYPDRSLGQVRLDVKTGAFNVVTYAFQPVQTPLGIQNVGVLLCAVDPRGRLFADGGPGILGAVTATSASSVIDTPNAFSDMEFASDGRLYTADPGASAAIAAIDDAASQNYRIVARYVCGCDFLRIAIDADYVYAVDTMGIVYQFRRDLDLVREVDTASGEGAIRSIAPDPDDGVWFADRAAGRIGYVSSTGAVHVFTPPFSPANRRVDMIATAADGTTWFVGDGDSQLVRVDLAGRMTSYAIPGLQPFPQNRGLYFKGTFGIPNAPSELVFQGAQLLVVDGV